MKNMDFYKLIKKPGKKSACEILVKTIIVVGALAAITLLVCALYRKWKKCTTISVDNDFDDEWFCDCDEPENACCAGECDAEGNCEDKEI